MQKELRQKRFRLRKNFILSLAVIVVLWTALFILVNTYEPTSLLVIVSFFAILLAALSFSLSFIFVNTGLGVAVSMGATAFLVLRYFELGNIVNLVLIFGLTVAGYLYKKR